MDVDVASELKCGHLLLLSPRCLGGFLEVLGGRGALGAYLAHLLARASGDPLLLGVDVGVKTRLPWHYLPFLPLPLTEFPVFLA